MIGLPRPYGWKRFWVPSTGRIDLADGGYLLNPLSDYGKAANPDLRSFDEIASTRCLILLGEPGMGKTYAMEAIRQDFEEPVADGNDHFVWMNLRSHGNEVRLLNDLFGSRAFQKWLQSDQHLHIFLDSFDECLLRIDYLGALLVDELKKYPVSRLSIRIACRTADWPGGLTAQLAGLWPGEGGVSEYELAPLRREDVVQAVEAEGLDPAAFLAEVDHRAAVPWAIKPLTLRFLTNIFRRDGGLPPSQTELYREGCRILCEEPNPSRPPASTAGSLTTAQRLVVASRIAAVTVFAQRAAVWTGLDLGTVPPEDVLIGLLSGGAEDLSGDPFPVTEGAVRETLGTGLFSSRGPDRMGWAHQAYADFLATEYVVGHRMSLTQLRSLIVHPGSPDLRLVPQLQEPAAWLAVAVPELFHEIATTEPDVLLRGDVQAVDKGARALLVKAVLDRHNEEHVRSYGLSARSSYSRLAHPDLADQLRIVLWDAYASSAARFAAVDIAEACEVRELQPDLLALALDVSQQRDVRVHATGAIANYGDLPSKIQLKPLVTGLAEDDDPDDRLKGHALRAIWPDALTAEELFHSLTTPRAQNLLASYQAFLLHDVEPRLAARDIPAALAWIAMQDEAGTHSYEIDMLILALLNRAWQDLETPDVLPRLAQIVVGRFRRHEPLTGHESHRDTARHLERSIAREVEKRRRLLIAVASQLTGNRRDINLLAYSRPPLMAASDVPWLLDMLTDAQTDDDRQLFASLIGIAFDWADLDQVSLIYDACMRYALLADEFAWLLTPTVLASDETRRRRDQFFEHRQIEEERAARRMGVPSPVDEITSILTTCESGNPVEWWELTRQLTREVGSTHYGDLLQPDLRVLPGWGLIDAQTQTRIMLAAERYIVEGDPHTDTWLGKASHDWRAIAGYKALRLVLSEAPLGLDALPSTVWERWAPIIITYPSSQPLQDVDNDLVERANQYASDQVHHSILATLDDENQRSGAIWFTDRMSMCWTPQLSAELMRRLSDGLYARQSFEGILRMLLHREPEDARSFAEALVTNARRPVVGQTGNDDTSTQRPWQCAIAAAAILFEETGHSSWAVIWHAIERDAEFGKLVFEDVLGPGSQPASGLERSLDETQLANLYTWLEAQYPDNQVIGVSGVHWVSPEHRVRRWNQKVLEELVSRGTSESYDAIRSMVLDHPDDRWLKFNLREAERITRTRTWQPPSAGDVLRLAKDPGLRRVENGNQLLNVLIESLGRLQQKLQGETPAAIDIWNEVSRRKYRPREENDISDYVKRHLESDLRDRLLVVNREVEIRRSFGQGSGERTDIHVVMTTRRPGLEGFEQIRAIIETKGCWNDGLWTDMQSQLVDRYLRDNACQHGLYLVGWFDCARWDSSDRRRGASPRSPRDEAQRRLDDQASVLSQGTVTVRAFVLNAALR